jgi:hypothetical protein
MKNRGRAKDAFKSAHSALQMFRSASGVISRYEPFNSLHAISSKPSGISVVEDVTCL